MKFFRFSWLRLIAFILILLLGSMAFLVGTQSGSRWLLNTVMSQINGRMLQIEGTIWSGIRTKELEVTTPAIKIVAEDSDLAINWLSLLRARLHVKHLSVGDLSLELFPTETDPEKESSSELSLPISIQVDEVSVGQFTMTDAQGKNLPVGLSNFDLEDLLLDSSGQTTAELRSLTVSHPDVKSELNGTVVLDKLAYPWPMHLKLNAANTGPHTQSPLCVDYLLGKTRDVKIETSCQIDAQAEIDGGLDDLDIKLTAEGVEQGFNLNLDAGLDIEATIPISSANIDLQVAKDMRLKTSINSVFKELETDTESDSKKVVTHLEGNIAADKFNLDLLERNSRLDAEFDFVIDFDEQSQLQNVLLNGGIFRGSRWRGEPLNAGLNVDVDLSEVFIEQGVTAWEALRLNKADILMRLGDNSIESKGQFLTGNENAEGLRLDADLRDLSQFMAEIGGRAELKLNLLGNLAEHDVKASASYEPQPSDADSEPDSLSVKERVASQYGLGKEPLSTQFDLIGSLSSENGRYHWQADLDKLLFEHAGIKLQQKESTHLAFNQEVDDFLFEIAEADLSLSLSSEHEGALQHLQTTVTSNGWTTEGNFNQLIIDNRFIQLIGLEENVEATLAVLKDQDLSGMTAEERQQHQQAIADVTKAIERKKQIKAIAYDGNWNLQAQPELLGSIKLERHGGNTILPLEHPLPLDLADINIDLDSKIDEGISQLIIAAQAKGNQSELDAKLAIESGFMMAVKKAAIGLNSTDGGELVVNIDTERDREQELVHNWQADIDAKDFNLNAFSLGHLPDESSLNIAGKVDAVILQGVQLMKVQPDLQIKSGSKWNNHELSGQIKALADLSGVFALPQQIVLDSSLATPKWYQIKLKDIDTLITLDQSHITLIGDLGQTDDELKLDVQMPQLADWWPDLPGQVQADLSLKGDPNDHDLSLNVLYDSFLESDKEQQPLLFNLDLTGVVAFENAIPQRWQISIADLNASYAGLALESQQAMAVDLNLLTDKQQFGWEISESELLLSYPDGRQSVIHHQHSQGQSKHWETQGSLDGMIASMSLYEYLLSMADSLKSKQLLSAPAESSAEEELVFDGDWDLKQEDQISGAISLVRKDSSGIWPFPTPVPLDFDKLALKIDKSGDIEHTDENAVSADGMHINAMGEGENSHLKADVFLHPASPFMLEQALVNLALPDDSTLNAHVFTGKDGEFLENTRLYGLLQTSGVPLEKVSYGAVPPGVINGDVHFNINLSEENVPRQVFVTGGFNEGSRWNNQPLRGALDIGLFFQDERNFNVTKADIDLRLGQSHITSAGAFGESEDSLKLAVKAPRLNELWPDLPGSVDLDLSLDGTIENNKLATKGRFSQGNSTEVGKAPLDFELRAEGGWKELTEDAYEGWAGVIEFIDVRHAGFEVIQAEPVELSFIPQGAESKPQWQVGSSTISIVLPGNHKIGLEQGGSEGKAGKFDTKGAIRGLALTPQLIADLTDAFGVQLGENGKKSINEGIIVRGRETAVTNPPVFDAEWDINFDGALSGKANIQSRGGDFMLPSDPPTPLGLQNMALDITSQAQSGTKSLLTANLDLATASKGNIQGTARLNLDGFTPVFDSTTSANVVGHMDDISWLTGLTGDLVELGGRVDVDVTANYRQGNWVTSGGVTAEDLRIVEVENGIRLLDGTLDLGLNGNDIVINKLYFPSVIRIMPKEWRTRQWIEENPPAQKGSLDITGQWNLQNSRGQVNVLLDHYPIMQRTDRFAMLSGQVDVDVALPRIVVNGKVVADAGWVSVDIKGTAPTVDSDVVVVRKGEEVPEPTASDLDLDLDFTVDLGKRFYVVGYGLDAGLVGAITIKQAHNELTAEGQFNTRGGAIEAYGQRLQIRRGRIGFQGDITNPVLDIEALRTNLEVEAGLRVVGNARNPKISLISYPEVSEVEKLSWLIMGRGPDSSGGDLAMLFTVGTSLLGGDATSEPLHKQLGLDDVAVRKGDVGESGSILPRRTVGDSTAYEGQNDISEQFLKVTKKFKRGISVSIEQALSGSGTVARVSYDLIRYLSVDAKVGTVSGVEMVYRRFFRD